MVNNEAENEELGTKRMAWPFTLFS